MSSAPFLSNIYRFDELTTMQLYDVLQLRAEVFVVEQDCVYQDADGNDTQALHLLIYAAKRLVAYARIFLPGVQDPQHAIIGRVVVRQAYRKEGLGKKISLCQTFQLTLKYHLQRMKQQEKLPKYLIMVTMNPKRNSKRKQKHLWQNYPS